MSKYRAKALYLNISTNEIIEANKIDNFSKDTRLVYFASRYEYRVFLALQNCFDFHLIEHQKKIEVIPKNRITCFPNGKYWKVDFAVKRKNNSRMLIEAKGCLTKEFLMNLTLLELNNQECFNRLWIVFPRKIPNNLILKRLLKTSMENRIMTLERLIVYLKDKNF